ncbi:MAG: hypothetical protein EA421_00465 [Gemmatimonadales bacterium]|nr:MAG: hypothetical protein EA421_00465 [Gemmatimonadales bacterium]
MLNDPQESGRRLVVPRGCFSCGRAFPVQDALDLAIRGTSFAFDPEKGRLWIICRGCRSWMLVPIEDRWEVLEELERRTLAEGRVIGATDHVSLVLLDDLEVVRIGSAPAQEAAFWRYGRRMVRRHVVRERSRRRALAWESLAHLFTVGLPPSPAAQVGAASMGLLRWWKLGGSAWDRPPGCARCGAEAPRVRLTRSRSLRFRPGVDGSLEVHLPCGRCGDPEGAGASLKSVEGQHVLRRVLAYHNFYGATRAGVDAALQCIEEAGSSQRYLEEVGRSGPALGELPLKSRLALEMALHDQIDRSLRTLELRDLEGRWLEEERLARIIDRELT